ncbi:CBN-RNP-7 protein [Umbelopsis sp. PMI_123]|nr:CBN-RNP-7 protein [Umbelopsis sp. PMI_123]
MTDKLPPNLLKLFAPRPPLPYIPPLDKDPSKRKGPQISGISQYTDMLKNYDRDYVPWKSIAERKKEKMETKKKAAAEAVENGLANWNPESDDKVIGDPFCVLFVSRLSYNITEDDLMREFDMYGPIKNIRLVRDKDGKSRGYAFIEYEREKDMRAAYKDADGLKLDGHRVLVDVERGRTVKGWKPRRLGGGLGNTRSGGPDHNSRHSGRNGTTSGSSDRYRERGGSGSHGYGRYNSNSSRRDQGYGDRRGKSRSRSRSPRGYRDRDYDKDRYGGRGRDRSRDRYDRGPRRDR